MTTQDLSIKLKPILASYGVKKAALFGSAARNQMTEHSDIDILVELGKKMSLLDYVGLKLDLEDALGKSVDLVQYTKIRPELKEFILKDETVFYTQ